LWPFSSTRNFKKTFWIPRTDRPTLLLCLKITLKHIVGNYNHIKFDV
jgi:hypothetical protein